jgi:hypothetical protein
MDAVGEPTELGHDHCRVHRRAVQTFSTLALAGSGRLCLGDSKLQGEGQEPLLGAVVQIPFEGATRGVGGCHHPCPGLAQVPHLGQELRSQALVVDGEHSGRPHTWPQRHRVAQRRVVPDPCHPLLAAHDVEVRMVVVVGCESGQVRQQAEQHCAQGTWRDVTSRSR